MVSGKFKSRSKRKVFVKAPGNTIKVHYSARKPARAVCPIYGTPLSGVPRKNPADLKKLSKSERKPERPFGGMLSSKATRDIMKDKARSMYLEDESELEE